MSVQKIQASIITIGDELLIGQTIDTNSSWMATELNKIGLWVRRRVAVGDVRDEIWQALDEESRQSQIVLITGGLGPTADDITKPLLCDYFGGKMVVDEGALKNVENIFTNILKRPMIERNRKQAEVPDVCEVLLNKRGTAPGMLFRKENRIFVSLPGVPHEMKGLMTDAVLPLLQKEFELPRILHRTLLTAGAGESFIAERISSWEEALPAAIKLAYLPNYGMVRLRLTSTVTTDAEEQELNRLFDELQELVKDIMVINEDQTLEFALGQLLQSKQKTLATAESCTGGYIAHLITSNAGSSAYFKGSAITYANNVKEQILGVQHSTLEKQGAVSEATVTEMVKGILEQTQADYAIATSGIMGPGGETPGKPVGTVWVAIGSKNKTEAMQFHFRFDRMRNIHLTAANALLLMYRFVQNEA